MDDAPWDTKADGAEYTRSYWMALRSASTTYNKLDILSIAIGPAPPSRSPTPRPYLVVPTDFMKSDFAPMVAKL